MNLRDESFSLVKLYFDSILNLQFTVVTDLRASLFTEFMLMKVLTFIMWKYRILNPLLMEPKAIFEPVGYC
jgi:hypothetical protein